MFQGMASSNKLPPNASNSANKVLLTTISVEYLCKGSSYCADYDSDICLGELIRNLCVNLNIDPDTDSGYTRNVEVRRMNQSGSFTYWEYNPHCSILKALTESERSANIMHLAFKLNDEHCG